MKWASLCDIWVSNFLSSSACINRLWTFLDMYLLGKQWINFENLRCNNALWPSNSFGQVIFGVNHRNGDESTHQILSYGLLFLTFYHFPYTADPPTSTAPMRPFPTITQRFMRSPPTIPYTHRTIGPVPCWRPLIWPTDHIVTFPFLSLFSFTQRILSRSDQSQIVTPHDQDLTICCSAHEPCACFTYCSYLRLVYLLQKTRKFSPRTQT